MVFVYRIGSLGDSLVSLPALHYIKQKHKNEKIILLTKFFNSLNTWDVLKYSGIFDNVVFYDKNILDFIIKVRSFSKDKNSILYYLPPFRTKLQVIRDKIVFKLCGIEIIKGIDDAVQIIAKRDNKGNLLKLEKEYIRLINMIKEEEIYLPKPPLLKPLPEHYKKIDKLLNDLDDEYILIAVAPGTKMPAKQWNIDKFVELIKLINKNFNNLFFIVIGGKEDFKKGEYLESRIENVKNFCGQTSIIESAALLERCKIFIGNDTGTMHLASIMGVPVLAIFSARDNPGKWEPYGENNIVIRKDVDCAGCMLEVCDKNNKCLDLISVEEVYEKFNILFNKVISD
jgi:heptosyltransferase-3